MKSLIIIGAGGHSKQCIEIAELMGYINIKLYDDFKNGFILGYEIINEIDEFYSINCDFFIGIGDNKTRKIIHEKFIDLNFINLIHPKANISKYSKIGKGNYIGFQTNILQDTIIGSFNILNDMCCIAHDSTLGNYNHTSIHSFMAGNSHIGDGNFICGHAMIIPSKTMGNWNILGANSTLLKDCSDDNVLVGNPAKKIK
jgi:acetyltransferase EpsM